jgi:hypothetical protein
LMLTEHRTRCELTLPLVVSSFSAEYSPRTSYENQAKNEAANQDERTIPVWWEICSSSAQLTLYMIRGRTQQQCRHLNVGCMLRSVKAVGSVAALIGITCRASHRRVGVQLSFPRKLV